MKHNDTHPLPEPIESRIAPAVFFLNGAGLTILNEGGAAVTANDADAALVGATKAILLHAGDSLVFDLNGNHQLDRKTEFTLLKVNAGSAEAFFTDTNGGGRFDASELTGIAAGNGLDAAIIGDVEGSIVTALDASGAFTATTLQPAGIASTLRSMPEKVRIAWLS